MKGRELLIGVTGGIAAYKTAALVSQLVQAGAGVTVVMTRSATRLVGPKTFEALTGRPVGTRVFGPGGHPHIELAEKADLLCVAPATANILAKAACGLADDLLSTLLLSFSGPVLMAPAMNSLMWEKPAVQTERGPTPCRRRRADRSRGRISELRHARPRPNGRAGEDFPGDRGAAGNRD